MNNNKINLQLNQLQTPQFHKPAPQNYRLDEPLQAAVEVAIRLGMPLLITGEPGTGKTLLAHKIAMDLSETNPGFLGEPLVFHTKTAANSSDLFYQYDAIRHFHDASIHKEAGKALPAVSNYIDLQALGTAIALTHPAGSPERDYLNESKYKRFEGGSVVLIDEIDKAPRDFPNDILYEIERYAFELKEDKGREIVKNDAHKIIIIMTSNSEKNLPDAFLRRCVFYNIPFPDEDKLLEIVQSHLGETSPYSDRELVQEFLKIRKKNGQEKTRNRRTDRLAENARKPRLFEQRRSNTTKNQEDFLFPVG